MAVIPSGVALTGAVTDARLPSADVDAVKPEFTAWQMLSSEGLAWLLDVLGGGELEPSSSGAGGACSKRQS